MPKIQIDNHTIEAKSGSALTEIAEKHPDLPLKFGCRRGKCGVCAVEVVEGRDFLTRKSADEEKTLSQKGFTGEQYRLGCQCAVNGSITLKTKGP